VPLATQKNATTVRFVAQPEDVAPPSQAVWGGTGVTVPSGDVLLYGGCPTGLHQFSGEPLCTGGVIGGLSVYQPSLNQHIPAPVSLDAAAAALMADFPSAVVPSKGYGSSMTSLGNKVFITGGIPDLSVSDFTGSVPYHKLALSSLVRLGPFGLVDLCAHIVHILPVATAQCLVCCCVALLMFVLIPGGHDGGLGHERDFVFAGL